MKNIGDRIREAREARGVTPSDLVRMIKQAGGPALSPQAIYQIESGATKTPKPENVLAIADALGEDIIFLISGQKRGNSAHEPQQTSPSPAGRADYQQSFDALIQVAELTTLFAQTGEKGRKAVLATARSMRERFGVDGVDAAATSN